MAFRETTSLLTHDDYPRIKPHLSELARYKKYLIPACVIIPLIAVLLLVLADNAQSEPPGSEPSTLNLGWAYTDPEIIPIPDLIANGSVRIEKFQLVLTKGFLSPDGTRQEVYLINGQHPGPIIRVQQNSILQLTVVNRLPVPITIHMHGIHQRGSYLSDGVPQVTQNPIPPGESFIHTVNTWPQTGTFFYHAHTGMDIAWVSGPLIIEDDPEIYKEWPAEYQYDQDRIFFLNGVYHQNLDTLMTRLTGPVFSYPRVDSVTINGKGHGLDPPPIYFPDEPSATIPAPTPKSKHIGLDVTAVKPKMRYRFRFISSISDGTFTCKILGHNFTVIEMDGVYTEPVETERLVISPGQRYSILITMDQGANNSFLVCKHLEISGPTGLSLVDYASTPSKKKVERDRLTQLLNDTLAEDVPDKQLELQWILDELSPNFALKQTDTYEVPDYVDKEFLIDVEEVRVGTQNMYFVNGHLFQEPAVSYHEQLSQSINVTDPPQVFEVLKGDVVQIIFQNQRLFSVCFGHPWHLHGHSFHVVGSGPDRYDPVIDGETIKENVRLRRKMQFRDTVTLNGFQTAPAPERPKYCGWTAIRFIANNPGIWLTHCHVTPHLLMGKRFIIWEHTEDDPYFLKLNRNQLPTH